MAKSPIWAHQLLWLDLGRSAMHRSLGKPGWIRFALLVSCAALLFGAFVTNVLWASAYRRVLFRLGVRSSSPSLQLLQIPQPKIYLEEDIPFLDWEEMASAPVNRLDGAAVQIGNLFYVFAGYATIDEVHSHLDVYNLSSNKWVERIEMPREMAHSHLGMVHDGRYIYAVTGQYGPQCRGPTSKNFVLDTQTRSWSELPSLPVPRYAPATQLWRGRLHVMGGSKEDRWEPGLEHWSLAVHQGKAMESKWHVEVPIPRGGPHRAAVVVDDRLYVIGGQEGDFKAKPGSPIFKCSRQREVVHGNVYMLEGEAKTWKALPPMPKPDSHIEFAWVVVNNSIVIVGGSTSNNPVTKKMVLIGEVFQFDLTTLTWRVLGRMPYRVKTTLVAYWNGWLYFTSGQRDKGPNDPAPKKVLAKTWRTKLKLPSSN